MDAEKALGEAQDSCPCRLNIGVMCNDECGHAPASLRLQSMMSNAPCLWTGHAAIDRAVRAAFEAGLVHGLGANDKPRWLPKEDGDGD